MMRLRWLLLGLAVLSAGMVGMAAWASSPRAYQNAVYYRHVLVTGLGPGASAPWSLEEWIDPQRRWVRSLLISGQQRSGQLLRDGRQFDTESGTTPWVLPAPRALLRDVASMSSQLQQGGFRALYAPLLGHATGAMVHVRFVGRPALRFVTGDPSANGFSNTPTTIWLDAQTHVELQNQTSYGDGTVFTTRVMRTARLDPGALPSNFFDPPDSPPAIWDRVAGWVREQMDRLNHT